MQYTRLLVSAVMSRLTCRGDEACLECRLHIKNLLRDAKFHPWAR